MSVRLKQREYILSLDKETQTAFDSYVKRIMAYYDNAPQSLSIKDKCPLCGGRQKLPQPYNVECPCREAFSRVLYFGTLIRHKRDAGALPKEGLYNLPRIILFRSDLKSEAYVNFLFYWAIKCNLFHRYQARKTIHGRNIQGIIDSSKSDEVLMPKEYLTYVYLDSIPFWTDNQETFVDSVLTNFVDSRHGLGKAVWMYQSKQSQFSLPLLYDKVETLGRIITWDSSVKSTSSQPSRDVKARGTTR